MNAAKATWKWIGTLPSKIKIAVLQVWQRVRQIPEEVLHFAKRIPGVFRTIGRFLWDGMKTVGSALRLVVGKTVSLLHTIFEAIATFYRNLTLANIWAGITDLLEAGLCLAASEAMASRKTRLQSGGNGLGKLVRMGR